jgi:hypothetical protein
MRKIKGDKPVGVIIHIYMEISQGTSLCNYPNLKQVSCFSFLSFLFFFYKLREQEGRTGPVQRGGLLWGRWEVVGKADKRVNKKCVHM